MQIIGWTMNIFLDHAMKSSGLGSSGELIVLFGKITRWVPGAMWVEDRKT